MNQLREACEHGRWDEHHVMTEGDANNLPRPVYFAQCPGGRLLPADTLMVDELTEGIERIALERQRQIETEGWTAQHDAAYEIDNPRRLLRAAISYAFAALHGNAQTEPDPLWPFHASWWKPSDDPVRNLEKAGALIAAEIDMLAVASRSAIKETK